MTHTTEHQPPAYGPADGGTWDGAYLSDGSAILARLHGESVAVLVQDRSTGRTAVVRLSRIDADNVAAALRALGSDATADAPTGGGWGPRPAA